MCCRFFLKKARTLTKHVLNCYLLLYHPSQTLFVSSTVQAQPKQYRLMFGWRNCGPVFMRQPKVNDYDWPDGKKEEKRTGPSWKQTLDYWTHHPWQLWSEARYLPELWQSGHRLILWWIQSLSLALAPCNSCQGFCGSVLLPLDRRQQ